MRSPARAAPVGTPPPALRRPHRLPAEAEVRRHDEDDQDEGGAHDDEHGEDGRHGELAHLGERALARLGLHVVQLGARRALPGGERVDHHLLAAAFRVEGVHRDDVAGARAQTCSVVSFNGVASFKSMQWHDGKFYTYEVWADILCGEWKNSVWKIFAFERV